MNSKKSRYINCLAVLAIFAIFSTSSVAQSPRSLARLDKSSDGYEILGSFYKQCMTSQLHKLHTTATVTTTTSASIVYNTALVSTPVLTTPVSSTSTISVVASIVMGEVAVVPQAGDTIAQMVVRDLKTGRSLSRWHGRATPNAWALECAMKALHTQTRNVPLFALSEKDILKLGFDKSNWKNIGNDTWPVWVGNVWR